MAAGAPELALLRDGSPAGPLAALGTDRLTRALAAIVDAQMALIANVNPTLAVERLLIALKRQERPASASPAGRARGFDPRRAPRP